MSGPWEHFATKGKRKMEFARRERVETGVNHPGGQRPDSHWYDTGKVLNRRLAKFGDSDVQGSLGKR